MERQGRSKFDLRPLKIQPYFNKNGYGNVLIEAGDTKLLCTVSAEESLPGWLRNAKPPQGWLTAEYSMLPGSTKSRSKRERNFTSGRTQEIQRLISRSLRGIINLRLCQDLNLIVDCDVLQADGGTRTLAITGGYVALKLAIKELLRIGKLQKDPLTGGVAAVSVGLNKEDLLVDLDYKEDSNVDADINVVMTHTGQLLEIQGTAEKVSFSQAQLNSVIEAAQAQLPTLIKLQNQACDGQNVQYP